MSQRVRRIFTLPGLLRFTGAALLSFPDSERNR
jgi:hypothetical protein